VSLLLHLLEMQNKLDAAQCRAHRGMAFQRDSNVWQSNYQEGRWGLSVVCMRCCWTTKAKQAMVGLVQLQVNMMHNYQ
jgi:hypothetical protein